MKEVDTNIGRMPVLDYLDMRAWECGYDSYEDFYNAGLRVPGYENVIPE